MTLREAGGNDLGDDHSDLRLSMAAWSEQHGYPINRFADVECSCGSKVFQFANDEEVGAAMRVCVKCKAEHVMCDGEEYLEDDEELEMSACFCEGTEFEGTVGVNLYADSNDVRWFYLGMRCVKCSVLGVYADWKSESGDADAFLANV